MRRAYARCRWRRRASGTLHRDAQRAHATLFHVAPHSEGLPNSFICKLISHPSHAGTRRDDMKRIILSALLLLLASLGAPSAQAFPERPIKLIVSSPAGGAPDIVGRLVSEKMAAPPGQSVVGGKRA